MNTNTNSPDFFEKLFQNTPVGDFWRDTPDVVHVLLIIALAFATHIVVKIIRHASEWLINKSHAQKNPFGFVTE